MGQTDDVKETESTTPTDLLLVERQYVEGDETTEKFSGKELDEQTGWFHFGQRDLMAILGRWPSPDRFAEKYPSPDDYEFRLYFLSAELDTAEMIYGNFSEEILNDLDGFQLLVRNETNIFDKYI